MIELYNTYTQKKEPFKPIREDEKVVSMYVCGPTVYNDPHIGNARPMVVFDTLKKTLEANGYDVTYASNYTDVDDKIIEQAIKTSQSEKELTDHYIREYEAIQAGLNVDKPDLRPRVSETMDQIITFIDELVKKGAAYQKGGDVYYRVSSNEHYGELSHQDQEDLLVGARIEENDNKENPLDFTLWKATDRGIQWDSPWSKGRPGWHTECVVMIQDVFGQPTIDLHGGGMDLRFPHHENEMAQARSINDLPLANYWAHNGMINIDQQKMSKSLGNVWLVKDLLEHCSGNELRWLLLSTHYRAPLNLSSQSLETSKKELKKVENALKKADLILQLADYPMAQAPVDQSLFDPFLAALNDDLNTPNAIAALFNLLKEINLAMRTRTPDLDRLASLVNTLQKELGILGIKIEPVELSKSDRILYQEWKEASAAKDFEKADVLRKELQQKGIL